MDFETRLAAEPVAIARLMSGELAERRLSHGRD